MTVIGEELYIDEQPFGAEIGSLKTVNAVKVRDPSDARMIIESLTRYLETFEDDV